MTNALTDATAPSETIMTQREYLALANVSAARLKSFSELNVRRVVFDLGSTFALMVAIPVLYKLVPHWATFVLCVLLTIRLHNCLSELIHTSNHGDLFPNPTANAFFGSLCAYFLGFTRTGHAVSHHSHHLYLNTNSDPDRVFLGVPDPTTENVRSMWARCALDLLGVSAVRRLLQYLQTDVRKFQPQPWRTLTLRFVGRGLVMQLPVAIAQIALLLYYTVLIGPQYYFLIYVLPLFTIYTAQSRLRFYVEHAFEVGYRPSSPERVWIARSVRASLVERFLIAPLDMPYHFEHHLFPSVPYYNVRQIHDMLTEAGISIPTADGYFKFLWRRWREEVVAAAAT